MFIINPVQMSFALGSSFVLQTALVLRVSVIAALSYQQNLKGFLMASFMPGSYDAQKLECCCPLIAVSDPRAFGPYVTYIGKASQSALAWLFTF